MNSYFLIACLVLFALLFYYNKKFGLFGLPSVHFLIINIIAIFACDYLITFEHGKYETIQTELFYSALFCCSIIAVVKNTGGGGIKLNINFQNLDMNKIAEYINLFTFINFILLLFFVLSVNFDLLISNNEYLAMVDVKQLGISNPILIVYQKALAINGLLCLFLYGFLKSLRSHKVIFAKYACFIIGAFAYIYQLGNNSRSSGLVLVGWIVAIYMFERKSFFRLIKGSAIIILVFVSYITAIYGRGQTKQGISQIESNIVSSIAGENTTLDFVADNLFGGAYIFTVAKDMPGKYPEPYKYLSFSPFPSAIDGFDSYNKFQNRINLYEPYGSNVEVYHFGPVYWALYFILLYIGLKQMNLAVRKNKLIGYMICLPGYLFFMANQQYPLRSFFRFFLISMILSYLYVKYYKVKDKKPVPAT